MTGRRRTPASRRQWGEAWRQHLGRQLTRLAIGTAVASALVWFFKELVLGLLGDWLFGATGPSGVWIVVVGVALFAAVAVARRRAVAHGTAESGQPFPGLSSTGATFIGREADIEQMERDLGRHGVVAVVGRRAIGTSACALRVAHRVSERYPDGRVYLDLRNGATTAPSYAPPLSGPQALRRLLDLAGLAPPRSDHPRHLEIAAHSLRAWLADRKILIFIDNVDHPDPVEYLLHQVQGCAVLVAGCVELETLPGVLAHDLRELTQDEAVALLSGDLIHTAGVHSVDEANMGPDRRAQVELVNQCGRQPLAIRLLADLVRQCGWPPERANEVMRVSLDEASYGDESAHAALRPIWQACTLTYRDLTAAHHRVLRILAMVPMASIGVHAVAVAAGIPQDQANRLLIGLARRGLAESVALGHYQIRELVTPSARYWLGTQQSPHRVRGGARALTAHYARLGNEYANRLLPAPTQLGSDVGPEGESSRVSFRNEARLWFEHEHDLLVALVTHADLIPRRRAGSWNGRTPAIQRQLWRIAVSLCVWYDVEGRAEQLAHWAEVCEAVLRMDLAERKTTVGLWGTTEYGVCLRRRRELIAAWKALNKAVGLASRRRRHGLAQARTNLGLVCLDLSQLGQALRHLASGLKRRSRRDRRGQAITMLGLGAAHLIAARRDPRSAPDHRRQSLRRLTRAADLFDALGDDRGVTAALNNLAIVAGEEDPQWDGLGGWEQVLAKSAAVVDPTARATVLLNMAAVTLVTRPERIGQVRAQLEESLSLRSQLPNSRGTALTHLYLGDTLAHSQEIDQARHHWQIAWDLLHGMGLREEAMEAERRLQSKY